MQRARSCAAGTDSRAHIKSCDLRHIILAGAHCAFGLVNGASVRAFASNRLASITKFASVLPIDKRKGASQRVPAIGASAISISRPSETYLTRVLRRTAARQLVRNEASTPPLGLRILFARPAGQSALDHAASAGHSYARSSGSPLEFEASATSASSLQNRMDNLLKAHS